MLELLLAEPEPMPLRPVLAAEEAAAVPVQELDHALPPAQDIAPNRLAAPQQIPDRLLCLVGHMDGGQLAGPEQSHELPGVPLVGLDALARAPRGQRRRDHLTGDTKPGDLAIQVIARHARLVANLDGALALQP